SPFDAAAPEASPRPLETLLAPGRWQNALTLDGHSFISDRPATDNLHTLACWVRIPADASLGDDTAILTWPRRAHMARLTWNRDPERGKIGALRTEQDSGVVVGGTNLRDGQWHHIAVLLLGGGKKAPGTTHVKQFVDGKLDGTGAFSWREKPVTPRAG